MVILRSCAFGVALLVGSACADSDQSDQETELTTSSTTTTSTSTTIESPSTTDATSTTTSVDLDPDTQAAIDFIDAWAQGDAERMRELAPAEQVEIAMGFGTAEGEPDCSTQTSGQYECVVDVSSGTRVYLLIGEPGDRAGRVWWIAEYVPGT